MHLQPIVEFLSALFPQSVLDEYNRSGRTISPLKVGDVFVVTSVEYSVPTVLESEV
jgi:hypothetical protein